MLARFDLVSSSSQTQIPREDKFDQLFLLEISFRKIRAKISPKWSDKGLSEPQKGEIIGKTTSPFQHSLRYLSSSFPVIALPGFPTSSAIEELIEEVSTADS